jgi:hypothetical protein
MTILAIILMMIGSVMITGCTSTPSKTVVYDDYGTGSSSVSRLQQIDNNTYYMNCANTNDCAIKISEFGSTHNLVAFAPCDNAGHTSGYFFITK